MVEVSTEFQDETADAVYDALRDGLLCGAWRSGEKLKPQHLVHDLGCTTAAVREALLRLSGEGFVSAVKHQGFRVVEYDEQTFREAAHLRLLLECEGAELSLSRRTIAWEVHLSSAYHSLKFLEEQMAEADDIGPFVQMWSRHDAEFHRALIEASGSSLLMKSYRSVYDTFRMYAVSQIGHFGFDRDTNLKEHAAIYAAAINHDRDGLIVAIRDHLVLYKDGNRTDEPLGASKLERLARFRKTVSSPIRGTSRGKGGGG